MAEEVEEPPCAPQAECSDCCDEESECQGYNAARAHLFCAPNVDVSAGEEPDAKEECGQCKAGEEVGQGEGADIGIRGEDISSAEGKAQCEECGEGDAEASDKAQGNGLRA